MALFRTGPSPFQTALAMVAAKAGHRVLVVGRGDPRLAAEIAATTGLNGQTSIVVADPAAAARAEAAASEAGALLTIETAPALLASEPFDIVVLHLGLDGADGGRAALAAALAAVRPGGRVLAVEGTARTDRTWRPWRRQTPMRPADEVRGLFDQAGFKAARVLAIVAGAAYIEGVRARS